MKRLLHDLEVHRHLLASDTRHSLYRAQPEGWLESRSCRVGLAESWRRGLRVVMRQ